MYNHRTNERAHLQLESEINSYINSNHSYIGLGRSMLITSSLQTGTANKFRFQCISKEAPRSFLHISPHKFFGNRVFPRFLIIAVTCMKHFTPLYSLCSRVKLRIDGVMVALQSESAVMDLETFRRRSHDSVECQSPSPHESPTCVDRKVDQGTALRLSCKN